MGVAAGILELVPGIGPLTALIMVASQAGDRVLWAVAFLAALRVVQDYAIYPRLDSTRDAPVDVRGHPDDLGRRRPGGAAGVILALPVAGFLSVSLRHWREYRDIERLVRQAQAQKAAIHE